MRVRNSPADLRVIVIRYEEDLPASQSFLLGVFSGRIGGKHRGRVNKCRMVYAIIPVCSITGRRWGGSRSRQRTLHGR